MQSLLPLLVLLTVNHLLVTWQRCLDLVALTTQRRRLLRRLPRLPRRLQRALLPRRRRRVNAGLPTLCMPSRPTSTSWFALMSPSCTGEQCTRTLEQVVKSILWHNLDCPDATIEERKRYHEHKVVPGCARTKHRKKANYNSYEAGMEPISRANE